MATLLAGIEDVDETAKELCATRTQWLQDAQHYDEAKTKLEDYLGSQDKKLDELEKDDLMPTQEKLDKCKVSFWFY